MIYLLFSEGGSSSSLTALIKARQKSREQEVGNFFDALEKYSNSSKKPKVTKKQNRVQVVLRCAQFSYTVKNNYPKQYVAVVMEYSFQKLKLYFLC